MIAGRWDDVVCSGSVVHKIYVIKTILLLSNVYPNRIFKDIKQLK